MIQILRVNYEEDEVHYPDNAAFDGLDLDVSIDNRFEQLMHCLFDNGYNIKNIHIIGNNLIYIFESNELASNKPVSKQFYFNIDGKDVYYNLTNKQCSRILESLLTSNVIRQESLNRIIYNIVDKIYYGEQA